MHTVDLTLRGGRGGGRKLMQHFRSVSPIGHGQENDGPDHKIRPNIAQTHNAQGSSS
jgi:hypothetical protein